MVVLAKQREHEWARGGDAIEVQVEFRAIDEQTFHAALKEFTGVEDRKTGFLATGFMAKVTWTGAHLDRGDFTFSALDKRVIPPRIMSGQGISVDGKTQGTFWGSAYAVLAEHYDWFADATPELTAQGWTTGDAAGSATPVSPTGSAVVWFSGPANLSLSPTSDSDVILALIYSDDEGEVRWARRIAG
ncbi:hypothetical protein [Catelliglobosispora koreensis]|uniref:hypothetical protein n=1 Tax=Catelliglobosispora koreensis TaxID=129052 RepID=UPI0003789FAC|nr:hypothetical protein [Catelliglobosispora koreensis]